jgi:hypothetical protein
MVLANNNEMILLPVNEPTFGTKRKSQIQTYLEQNGGAGQELSLVHFSAQLEPCLAQETTLHTLNTRQHPLNTGYTTPTRTPYPIQSAQVDLRSERV